MSEQLPKDEIKDYTLGYNQGYLFAKELPSVSPKMFSNLPDTIKQKPRMKGMLDGISQQHKERYIEQKKSKAPQQSIAPTKEKPSPPMDR